jgi:hypothetical protein
MMLSIFLAMVLDGSVDSATDALLVALALLPALIVIVIFASRHKFERR